MYKSVSGICATILCSEGVLYNFNFYIMAPKRKASGYKSALFRRNAGGLKRVRRTVISARSNPHPGPSMAPSNSSTNKSLTFDAVGYYPEDVITNTGYLMDNVARGTADNQRIGSKWRPQALHLRGLVQTVQNAEHTDQIMSGYYVVWDKQPNQSLAQFSSVFIGTSAPFAFPSAGGDDRFVILRHKTFNMTYQGQPTGVGDANSNSQYLIDDYIKIPPNLICHANSIGSDGGIGTRISGALLFFPFSSKGDQSASRPLMRLSHRLYFAEV